MNKIGEKSNEANQIVELQRNPETVTGGRDIETGEGSENRIESCYPVSCITKHLFGREINGGTKIANPGNSLSYLVNQAVTLYGEVKCFLKNTDFSDTESATNINNTIKTLSVVIKTKERNALVNGLLISICNVILDEATEQWQKKVLALYILALLVNHRCFAAENKKFVEIVKGVESLFGHNSSQVVCHAILVMGDFAEARLLKGLETKAIEGLVVKTEGLLDHNLSLIVEQAILTIGGFAKAGLLKGLEPKVVERLMVKAVEHLGHNAWQAVVNAISMIGRFAEAGLLKGLEPKVVENLMLKAEGLLGHNAWQVLGNAILTIGGFAKAGLLKGLEPKVIEALMVKVEGLLGHNESQMVEKAIWTIGSFAEAGLLKGLETQVMVKVEGLLGHNEWKVILIALFALLSVETTDRKKLLAMVTEAQIRIVHEGIQRRDSFDEKSKRNIIMVCEFLSKHESHVVKAMSSEMALHVSEI